MPLILTPAPRTNCIQSLARFEPSRMRSVRAEPCPSGKDRVNQALCRAPGSTVSVGGRCRSRHFCLHVGVRYMFTKSLVAGLFSVFVLGAHAQTPAAPAAKAPAAEPAAAKAAAAPAPAPAAAAKPAATTGVAPAADAATAQPEVKKSKANICHDKTSPGYKQTKNFTPYATMDACIKAGGRAPKK